MDAIIAIRNFWPRLLGAVTLGVAAVLVGVPAPVTVAEPCPDIEVVFARGTGEAPGVGGVGQSYVDALRAQTGGRSVDVYPVNYPASDNFGAGIEFARTVVDGIGDAATHIEATAANCPDTRIVLGGYSQGAAVAGFTTSAEVPAQIPAEYRSAIPKPMPAEVANHVASVVLFGKPSAEFLQGNGAPPITIGPNYTAKTIELCSDGDTICNGATELGFPISHGTYGFNGTVGQAVDFTVRRL